jgi:hypothetical protein
MKYFSCLFIVLLFIGCHKESTSPTEQNNPKIGESFDLKIGKSVSIKDETLTFQFVNVPNDSRCPEDAVCVWAGNAAVIIEISDIKDTLNTVANPSEITYGSYKITLSKLSPYPKVGVPINTSQYVGQFVVTKMRVD